MNSSCLCFVADAFSKLSTVAMLYKIICRGTMRDKKYIAVFAGVSGLTAIWTISAAATWASRCSQPHLPSAPQLVVCSRNVSRRANDRFIVIAHIVAGQESRGDSNSQHHHRAVHLSVIIIFVLWTEHENTI